MNFNLSNKLTQIKSKKILFPIAMVLILVVLAIIVGIDRMTLSDFVPINGDFQNYNPVRRFLNGQIPFKDFGVYLGTGHLLLLSFFQIIFGFIFGNNFTTSLMVSNMVTFLAFEITVFFLSFLITKSKKGSFYITLTFAIINITRPEFLVNNIDDVILSALDFGLKSGNSARLIRIIVAPLSAILLYYVINKINTVLTTTSKKIFLSKIVFAIIGGICILWSNDGGVATYLAISFVYFLILIKEHKKNVLLILRDVLMYIVISIISFLAVLVIITRGNVLSWFNFTTQIGSYQKWYYFEAPAKMNISLLNVDLNVYNIILIIVSSYYVYLLFKSKDKKSIFNYALILIIVLSSIISCYFYQLFAGRISRDMLILVFLIVIFSYIYKIFYSIINNTHNRTFIFNVGKGFAIICASAVIINRCGLIINNIKNRNLNNEIIYIKELDGYFSEYGASIKNAIDEIEGKKIFSTYASALEAATNQFQPTGIDYIIHCMGDKQRQEYLKIFNQGDFDYVTTVDKQNVYSSKWIINANWFFYRELYKNYKPVFTTDYNVFWEKSDEVPIADQNVEVKQSKANDHQYNITVSTDDKTFSGMVDLKLSYDSTFKRSFFKSLDLNKYVYVKDITGKTILEDQDEIINFNIPNNSTEYYIPVTVINGVGKIQIVSYPLNNTKLNIDNVEVVDSYGGLFKYAVLSKNKKISNNTLYVDNTLENQVILNGVKFIKIGDIEQEIIGYNETDDYIELKVEKNASKFKYPNYFEVIK